MQDARPPVSPGEPAPDFSLPAVDRDEAVSLAEYRGRTPVLLALLLGLWCPFCRRQIAELGRMHGRLKDCGVELLGVVATPPENARLYFRFRPTPLRLAADPGLTTHRKYGVPKPEPTPDLLRAIETTRVDPFGDLPEPLPIPQASAVFAQADGYVPNETDRADTDRQFPQLKGLFLIDRAGIVRWSYIECAQDGVAGVGKLPSADVIVEAAGRLH